MKRLFALISGGSYYGIVIILIGLLLAVPLGILPFYPEEAHLASAFLLPAGMSVLLGLCICVMWPYRRPPSHSWQTLIQKGSAPVLFVWLYAFLAGAIPFMISEHTSFTLALFESVSGWTTTGLTVMQVSRLPHILLLHRSFMQYCGGLGFVIMIAVIARNQAATSLYNAEGHPDKLRPSIRGTAKVIAGIYLVWLLIGVAAYRVCGMPTFDAVCHTMSALSTAGFTTQDASIAAYHSESIDLVTIFLMLLGASNFYVIMLLMRLKLRRLLRETEVRFMLAVTVLFSLLAALNLMQMRGLTLKQSLLHGLFGVVTTFTTTGYSLEDYSAWPAFSLGLLSILMILGGCAGSTAGGIKLIRAWLLIRIAADNMRKRLKPARAIFTSSYRRHQTRITIDSGVRDNTTGFVLLYIAVLILGILLVTLTEGCSLERAAFEFCSALGTVGISNGLTSPQAQPATLYIEMAGMFLGRLEIIMVFVGIFSGIRAGGEYFLANLKRTLH